jgi:hypothetical protein
MSQELETTQPTKTSAPRCYCACFKWNIHAGRQLLRVWLGRDLGMGKICPVVAPGPQPLKGPNKDLFADPSSHRVALEGKSPSLGSRGLQPSAPLPPHSGQLRHPAASAPSPRPHGRRHTSGGSCPVVVKTRDGECLQGGCAQLIETTGSLTCVCRRPGLCSKW